MERAGINNARKVIEKNILLVDRHPLHAKKKAIGERKVKKEKG